MQLGAAQIFPPVFVILPALKVVFLSSRKLIMTKPALCFCQAEIISKFTADGHSNIFIGFRFNKTEFSSLQFSQFIHESMLFSALAFWVC